MGKRWFISAGANWFAFTATIAVGFFLMPFQNATLGDVRYGVWCVVESILAYFTLLDMGLAACLVRYTAKHHAVADRDGLNRMASACGVVYSAAGALALMLGVPLILLITPRLDAQLGTRGEAWPFMLVMLANLAATLPLSVFPSILDGLDRYTEKSLVRISCLIARTIAIVIVLNQSPYLMPLAVVLVVANLVEHTAFAALCWYFLPQLRFRVALVDRATLRDVRGYSVDAFVAMIAGRITIQTGTIALGFFLSPVHAAIYLTALRLVEYAKTLLRTITATLTPGVSAMQARGDNAGIAKLMLTATRWVLYIVLPVQVGLWMFGRPFLTRWMGPSFQSSSAPLAVLACSLAIGVVQSVAARILYGLGELRTFARLTILEAAANLLLTLTLLPLAGIVGVAWAVMLPHVIVCLLVIRLVLYRLQIHTRDYLAACAKPLVMILVPTMVWAVLGEPPARWSTIGVAIACGLIPYLGLVILGEFRLLGSRRVNSSVETSVAAATMPTCQPSLPST